MKFKKGTVVKIKTGTKVEDISFDISTWHGRIGQSEHDDMVLLELDSVVIKSLPEDYILETLRMTDIESFNEFYLDLNDVELATARDTLADVEEALAWIERKYEWKAISDGSPEEELLAEVMANAEKKADELYIWEKYLQEHLSFPFQAEVTEYTRGPIKDGDIVKVTAIVDSDEHYGILVNVRKRLQRFVFPLCDLTPTDEVNPNYAPVRAYAIWFANR